jgi:hypothetical protein
LTPLPICKNFQTSVLREQPGSPIKCEVTQCGLVYASKARNAPKNAC